MLELQQLSGIAIVFHVVHISCLLETFWLPFVSFEVSWCLPWNMEFSGILFSCGDLSHASLFPGCSHSLLGFNRSPNLYFQPRCLLWLLPHTCLLDISIRQIISIIYIFFPIIFLNNERALTTLILSFHLPYSKLLLNTKFNFVFFIFFQKSSHFYQLIDWISLRMQTESNFILSYHCSFKLVLSNVSPHSSWTKSRVDSLSFLVTLRY